MADPPPYPGTPRWVRIAAIVGGVLVLLFLIATLIGGGHGPGRHLPSSDAGGDNVSRTVAENKTEDR